MHESTGKCPEKGIPLNFKKERERELWLVGLGHTTVNTDMSLTKSDPMTGERVSQFGSGRAKMKVNGGCENH